MFTYQIRPRIFRHKTGEAPSFPADCEMSFHFQPLQPFGESAAGGRAAVRSKPAKARFNANNGEYYVESTPSLAPLDVTIEEPQRTAKLTGRTLTVSQRCESLVELDELVTSLYFILPPLFNISFVDPPYIERVDGMIGQTAFRWELDGWQMRFGITDQELQETSIITAWERIDIISHPTRRRLVAAIHYFHQACRLERASATVGEFLAEVILNLSKTLEVLFPPRGDGKTRDAIRRGLRSLGISDHDIECNFIPAVALRNEIDVGHVELGLFKMEQLKVIHQYCERATGAFHEMFDKVFEKIESEELEIDPYIDTAPRNEAIQLIERLRKCLEVENNRSDSSS